MSRPPRPFRPSPAALLFPLLLVVVGGVLLLQTTGLLAWDLWGNLWRFWPVLLIALGLQVLLAHRAPWLAAFLMAVLIVGALGGAALLAAVGQELLSESFVRPLGDLKAANVSVAFGAGDLTVDALPADSPNLVEGRLEGREAVVSFDDENGTEGLRVEMKGRPWFGGSLRANWAIALARSPRLSLDLDAGAAQVRLDLRDLQVSRLTMRIGAGSFEVLLPSKAELSAHPIDRLTQPGDRLNVNVSHVEINAGAANITLVVPPGVAASISHTCVACSFEVDEARFPRVGDRYESPNFATTTNGVTIDVRAAAARVTIR